MNVTQRLAVIELLVSIHQFLAALDTDIKANSLDDLEKERNRVLKLREDSRENLKSKAGKVYYITMSE